MGELPDHRMREAATRRGITLDSRAQQFHRGHFKDYHYILAADQSVKETLIAMAEDPEHEEKIFLISHFAESFQGKDVPDPYYGGDEDFDRVLDLLEEACQGLLDHLHERHKPTD